MLTKRSQHTGVILRYFKALFVCEVIMDSVGREKDVKESVIVGFDQMKIKSFNNEGTAHSTQALHVFFVN